MNITSFAISGQCSSGKSTLSKFLARELGWNYVNVGNEFKRLAEEHRLSIENFGSIPKKVLRAIDSQNEKRIKNECNIIWDGRLTCYLARSFRNVFKVYCKASLEIRAQRTATRDYISFSEAKKRILARDQEEKEVFRRLYGISELQNMKWINLIIDTSFDSPETLVLKVLHASHVL